MPTGRRDDPFKAIVAPQPIGWISTRGAGGAANLAPYSFFNAISDRPKLVMFSSAGMKDSAAFAIESGGFVARAAARGACEFGRAGLTQAPCRLVSTTP